MTVNPFQSPRTEADVSQPTKPGSPDFDPELWQIKNDAWNGFLLAIAGLILCIPYIFSPLAIFSGRRALKSIAKYDKGHEYERTAKRAVSLGILPLAIIAVVFVGFGIYFVIAIQISPAP